ncbi:right-handed parallel beta-helix repeat-containing protein [Burkholderia sp. BCC1998]|uniref:right-handed parallel beta-helix repeat-containing protein n=1 Tax=Burkholderia sp. BCC1998 TaxID=2817447 RepID=UPI002AB77011|nr:right-handed parallel beta-helix repeat-containing protein [Burkholderia sp. BCC1998]
MNEMRRSVLARLAGVALGGTTLAGFKGALADEMSANVLKTIPGTGTSIKQFGATGNGVSDDTAAFQAAANAGGRFVVPPGTYVVSHVSMTKSAHFVCAPGSMFKRKAGTDAQSGSYWSAGAAMFEVDAPGLTIGFTGNPVYDGNRENQVQVEPTGFFLKTHPSAVITGAPTNIILENAVFRNGTSGYLVFRGDNVQTRYETHVYLRNPSFSDTMIGKGKGDPSTPTALGYAPTYVLVMDYVHFNARDFHAEWTTSLTTGQYAATALVGTFYGSDYRKSGQPRVALYGKTTLRGVGRSPAYYDDRDMQNNGIGAIDMYGKCYSLFVEDIYAVGTRFAAVRAKASISRFSVANAQFQDCWRGIEVGASSTGPAVADVVLGNIRFSGGSVPAVDITGTSAGDANVKCMINSLYVDGVLTNSERAPDAAVLRSYYVDRFTAKSVTLLGAAPQRGISLDDVGRSVLQNIRIDKTGQEGIYISGGTAHLVSGFDIRNTGGAGITIANNPSVVTVRDGKTFNTVDYGVFGNNRTTHLTVESVNVDRVGGVSRGFYAGGGDATFNNSTAANVATPLMVERGANKHEVKNSWNAPAD